MQNGAPRSILLYYAQSIADYEQVAYILISNILTTCLPMMAHAYDSQVAAQLVREKRYEEVLALLGDSSIEYGLNRHICLNP